jgi:hypothetical protein
VKLVRVQCQNLMNDGAKLLPLLQKYNVSIVSLHALPIWNLSEEIVRPLFVDPLSVAGSEYGPLISMIALSPGKESSAVWELFMAR